MVQGARYVHTNLVARDWRALASFYENTLGCRPVPPERHFSGAVLEAGTGVAEARIDGMHLRLPGWGDQGPTIEIFSYSPSAWCEPPPVNRVGLGHIAFQVASVTSAREEVLREGGSAVGDVVTLATADGREVTWCYVRDPEGNIVELQSVSAARIEDQRHR